MKKSMIHLIAILMGTFPALAMAQGNTLDANGDGMISFEELIAVHPDVTSDAFNTADASGDGLLSIEELAAAEEAGLIPPAET